MRKMVTRKILNLLGRTYCLRLLTNYNYNLKTQRLELVVNVQTNH